MKRFWQSCAGAFALVLFAPAAGHALGGGASQGGDGWLSRHVVMVLGSRGSVCTGAVIAPHVIVTAAHCTAGSAQLAVAYVEDGRPVLQEVAAVARNPGFSGRTAVSVDLALLRLTQPLPGRFAPLTIDDGDGANAVGDSLTIAGFGLTDGRDTKSAGTLRSAGVKLLPRLFPRFLRLGVDDTLASLAICKGDSGGPVLAGSSLVGVVYAAERAGKAGGACGAAAQAVRLAPQRAWIAGVLRGW